MQSVFSNGAAKLPHHASVAPLKESEDETHGCAEERADQNIQGEMAAPDGQYLGDGLVGGNAVERPKIASSYEECVSEAGVPVSIVDHTVDRRKRTPRMEGSAAIGVDHGEDSVASNEIHLGRELRIQDDK